MAVPLQDRLAAFVLSRSDTVEQSQAHVTLLYPPPSLQRLSDEWFPFLSLVRLDGSS